MGGTLLSSLWTRTICWMSLQKQSSLGHTIEKVSTSRVPSAIWNIFVTPVQVASWCHWILGKVLRIFVRSLSSSSCRRTVSGRRCTYTASSITHLFYVWVWLVALEKMFCFVFFYNAALGEICMSIGFSTEMVFTFRSSVQLLSSSRCTSLCMLSRRAKHLQPFVNTSAEYNAKQWDEYFKD